MEEHNPFSESEIIEHLENKINRSGHNFENSVESILRKFSYFIKKEAPFLDKDGGTGRKIDFIASNQIWYESKKTFKTVATGDFRLVIECKDLKNYAWIFTKGELDNLTPAECIIYNQKNSSESFEEPLTNIHELFYASSCVEYPFESIKDDPNPPLKKGTEFSFEAFLSITKATRYFMDKDVMIETRLREKLGEKMNAAMRVFDFVYFQPLIVFSGKMYKAEQVQNKTKLYPIKFAQMPKEWVSKNYNELLGKIHFVTFENLPEYLDIIYHHYKLKFWKK